ncbi:hypothetical protein ES703_04969 [subsurface metagenome]
MNLARGCYWNNVEGSGLVRLTLIGTLFGIELPPAINELYLGDGRVFKNPIVAGEDFGHSPGANITLYKDVGGQRQIDRDVVKYLVDIEVDSLSGALEGDTGGVAVSGSGSVVATGAAALSVFRGQARDELERAILPLRLGTKARIIMLPAKLQGGDRNAVSRSGLDQPMPEPYGESVIVKLTEQDCDFLTRLADEVSTADLAPYQVPMEIFRDSFYKADAIERGLNLITCLESLFSQGPESIRFKLAYRTSCILEFGSANLYKTVGFIKEAYGHRSNLVHGARRTRNEARQWFISNVLQLEDIVRRALFIIVELRRVGTDLIGENNIDRYIFEDVLTGKSVELQNKVMTVGTLFRFGRIL